MSNVDTDDRAAKRTALDNFAAAPTREEVQQPQFMPMSSSVDRVFGAQQVAVYRDEQRVLQKLATLGAAAGDDWFYRFPVKSKNGQKTFIEGASIKLANDLARIYGNCEIDTRVMDLGPSWLIYARFTDFETGFALTRPFQQQKGGSKLGGDDDARRLDIAFQIGVSKAIRNVTVNALQTYADFAFEQAKNSLVDRIGKDVQKWRDQMAVRLKDRGVDVQRVEYVIGRAIADWTAPDIGRVIAMMKAISDGMATMDESFPPKNKQTGEDIDRETGEVTTTEGAVVADTAGTGVEPTPETKEPEAKSETAVTANPAPSTPAEPAAAPTKDAAGKAADGVPTNEKQYEAYALAWIGAADDAAAAEQKWKDDKQIRNKANVSEEVRERLKAQLDKKIAEIKDANKS